MKILRLFLSCLIVGSCLATNGGESSKAYLATVPHMTTASYVGYKKVRINRADSPTLASSILSQDGSVIAIDERVGDSIRVAAYSTDTGRLLRTFLEKQPLNILRNESMSSNGRLFAFGSQGDDGLWLTKVYSTGAGELPVCQIRGRLAHFSPDGQLIVATSEIHGVPHISMYSTGTGD